MARYGRNPESTPTPATRRHRARPTGTFTVKRGLAEMLRGGVIMDVVDAEQAKVAEDAGAVAVMALERVPADIRRDGGVARMSDPALIEGIKAAVTVPVMAKARIGHFAEAQVLAALGVDYIDESEVLTPADEAHHIDKWAYEIPFVCGATNLGEALRRISEGRGHDPLQGRGGHRQHRRGRPAPPVDPRGHPPDHRGRLGRAVRLGQGPGRAHRAGPGDRRHRPAARAPVLRRRHRHPGRRLPRHAARAPRRCSWARASSRAANPPRMARAIVEATAHYTDADLVAKVSTGLGRRHGRSGDRRRSGCTWPSVVGEPARGPVAPGARPVTVGVLALQGDVREHVAALDALRRSRSAWCAEPERPRRARRTDPARRRVDHPVAAARVLGTVRARWPRPLGDGPAGLRDLRRA